MAGGKGKKMGETEREEVVNLGCVRRSAALKYIGSNCNFSSRAAGGAVLALSCLKETMSLCAQANAGI